MARIQASLLAVLRCPVTGSALEQDGDELVSTGQDDAGERRRYLLDEGIPVLLPAPKTPTHPI